MKSQKTIGFLFIIGAIGVFIPYTILTIIFDYPDILRLPPSVVLQKFHNGGAKLIFTWLAFALLGLPLLVAYSLLGKQLESKFPSVRWITTIGIVSGIVQIIGLLRWVFIVPVLANDYINTSDPMIQKAIIVNFKVIHQFGGVLLGEHLGQLFTIIWSVAIAYTLFKASIISKWLSWLGYILSIIYLFAQAELFATVIPAFPVWDLAGFIGSTLWLIWLMLIGYRISKINFNKLNN